MFRQMFGVTCGPDLRGSNQVSRSHHAESGSRKQSAYEGSFTPFAMMPPVNLLGRLYWFEMTMRLTFS